MSDEELEILEGYLDGALAPDEAERVSHRLAHDALLAHALDRVRAERSVRQAVWQSLEPEPVTVDRSTHDALTAAFSADRSRRLGRFVRRASAVAAGLLIAFAGGWVSRGRVSMPATPIAPTEFQVALTDDRGAIIAVQHFSDPGQARQFAEDVGRWQSRRSQEDPGDFSQVSDEF